MIDGASNTCFDLTDDYKELFSYTNKHITHVIGLCGNLNPPHPYAISKSLHPPLSCSQREQRTSWNITPVFPKGNMAWENISGELDVPLDSSLQPAVFFWNVTQEVNPMFTTCFNFMINSSTQLSETRYWMFKITDLPSKLLLFLIGWPTFCLGQIEKVSIYCIAFCFKSNKGCQVCF